MNSEVQSEEQDDESSGGGFAFGDILFTLFRYKALIASSFVLGILAAVAVRFIKPPNYESTAKVYIPYVVSRTAIKPGDADTVMQIGGGENAVLNTEIEMLKSFDTAIEVASNIGPAKILAKYGGGSNRIEAASVIASGITVSPPKSMSLTVVFSHRDPDLVQPVMEGIVRAYMHRHAEMRFGNTGYFDERATEAAKKVSDFDSQIKTLMASVGVPDIRERQIAVNKEFDDLQRQVLKAESQIAQRKAELGELANTMTNGNAVILSPETITDYSDIVAQIEDAKRRKRALLIDGFTTNYPAVAVLDVKIREQGKAKVAMEAEYPTLKNYSASFARSGTTNGASRLDIESELTDFARLNRTIKSDRETLDKLREEAFKLLAIEPKFAELERLRKAAEDDYVFFRGSIEKTKMEDNGSGGVINMQVLQTPTPPKLDIKKMFKLVGAAFGGCVGLGLGIAFLFDMVLDRSIRRPSQIIRGLKLPVVSTIPDSNRKESTLFSWGRRNGSMKLMKPDKHADPLQASNAIAPWSPDNQLQSHIEGLRERVITHFEVRNVAHNPKLVAVTACMDGAGVTTLASGLAASLSRTGNGTVLLVDLNSEESVAHSFYKGKPGYGPSESIDADSDNVAENSTLSLAKLTAGQPRRDRLAGLLPPGLDNLSPKLKADAYDYIVFDMTAISPASVTPRLSGHMDLVLFVIESEATKGHVAKNAANLMRESRANVMAVLNKYYNPVPSWLAHD